MGDGKFEAKAILVRHLRAWKSWPQIVGGLSSVKPWITIRHGDIDHVHEITSANGFSSWGLFEPSTASDGKIQYVMFWVKSQKASTNREDEISACWYIVIVFSQEWMYLWPLWPPCLYLSLALCWDPFFPHLSFPKFLWVSGWHIMHVFSPQNTCKGQAKKKRKTHLNDTLKPCNTEKTYNMYIISLYKSKVITYLI